MSPNLEAMFCDTGWSEEYDCIPLRLRSKLLHSNLSKQCRLDAAAAICNDMFVDQIQDNDCNHQIVKKSNALIFATPSQFHNLDGSCLSFLDKISSHSLDFSGESGTSTAKVPYSEVVCTEKKNDVVEELVNKGFPVAPIAIHRDCSVASPSVNVQGGKLKHDTIYGFDHSLDNIVLGERRRMLLTRKLIQSSGSYIVPIVEQKNIEEISNSSNAEKGTAGIESNSVETALEEDAPELLKVLRESGILVDEMKLYGEEDSDGELDDSLNDDGFSELEAVISQLFSHRQTFLKFPLLHTKGAKISYCLACLLSLVEQTRFLRNRKWPVEWGWCRDLQSFIFVFYRHNRIVLERPEYGYATYFFELLNSTPAAWQIKRLVTALKLTSCGRITLMENKPLVVGADLSESEARVLAEYGWTPNTGLGTMLNYCDRVVHDRKNEMNSSEWRSKIGKQLMNGYNGGNIVSKNLLNKSEEDQYLQEDMDVDVDVQVKLEQ